MARAVGIITPFDRLQLTTLKRDGKEHATGSQARLVEGIYEDGDVGNQDMLNRAGGWGQALTLLKFWVEDGLKY